jgi:hypothetical protein
MALRPHLTSRQWATLIAGGNLAGGALALAASTVTSAPGNPVYPGPTYLLGLFAVNWLHGVMHLVIGVLGVALGRFSYLASSYLLGHTLWFFSLAMLGFIAFPGLQPSHTAGGIWINEPDHWGHVLLALASLLALTLTFRHASMQQA